MQTVFKTQYNHFEYQIMLSRFINILANKILLEKFDIIIILYLDNIFIYYGNKR